MRPWRGDRGSGCGVAVLSALARHSGNRSPCAVDARLYRRCGRADRERNRPRLRVAGGGCGVGGIVVTAIPKTIKAGFDPLAARADFEIFAKPVYGKPLVYLDSAASAQKPRQVLDAMRDFASSEYANVHRGVHYLSAKATDAYEASRRTVQTFLNA